MVSNDKLLNKFNQIRADIKKMNNENNKSKLVGMVAIALSFTAIAVTALYQAVDIDPIWSFLVFIVYLACGVIILSYASEISKKIKK
ncbi:MAG: hypothetical protein KAS76_02085 [Thermoplasmatales archaeon]|nr:hypothetical protein [Thermoplasmatales archaeon]